MNLLTKNTIILFLIGAILGPLCDLFHALSATSGYLHPVLFGQLAVWVPLLFGSATVLIGLSHVFWDRMRSKALKPLSLQKIMLGLGLFILIYALSGFVPLDGGVKTVLLLSLAFITWFILERTALGLFLALSTAFFGCLTEILLSSTGHFFYLAPDLWGIPYWLPAQYVAASVSVGHLARLLFKK